MKKIFLFLCAMFFISNVNAAVISYDQYSNVTSITDLNNATNRIYTDYNGNIGTSNILDGTLLITDFADSANPRIRTDENIGDYTYSGMLPDTAATNTSDISAGTSYVEGYRIVTAATSKTYLNSKDTWVYIDQNGAFQYVETALNATQPTTPANSLLLATVTTNSTAIPSVTDRRQTTPPGLRVYADYQTGLVISRDTATATIVTVGRGEIEFGTAVTNGKRRNIASKDVDFTTTGRGGLDTGTLAQGYYYIYAVPSTTITTTFDTIASVSSTDATGVTDERLIGWVYANSASAISPDSVGAYRGVGGSAPNICIQKISADQVFAATASTPVEIGGINLKFYSSGRPVQLAFEGMGNVTSGSQTFHTIFDLDGSLIADSEVVDHTESTLQLGVHNNYVAKPPAGTHTIKVKGKTSTQGGDVFTLKNRRLIVSEQ